MLNQGEIAKTAGAAASAVIGKLSVTLSMPSVNADGTITVGADMKAVNSLWWEEFRIFYAAIEQLPGDPTDWPVPAAPAGQQAKGSPAGGIAVQALVGGLQAALATNPALAAAVGPAVSALQALMAPATPTVPAAPAIAPLSAAPKAA